MITEDHLNDWLSKIECKLNGISSEISKDKLQDVKGMRIPLANDRDVFVSFEYLQEKSNVLYQLINCIREEIVIDTIQQNKELLASNLGEEFFEGLIKKYNFKGADFNLYRIQLDKPHD